MNIVCAIAAEDAQALAPDVLVLPEGTTKLALADAAERFPEAVIVTATPDGVNMRAQVLVGGLNQVEYLKIRGDGRSEGVGQDPTTLPFYESNELAVGILVCRDIEEIEFSQKVVKKLRESSKSIRLLCIPADMHGDWFGSGQVSGFDGVYVALSNNNETYPVWRALSFIAKPDGIRMVTQSKHEPIVATAA